MTKKILSLCLLCMTLGVCTCASAWERTALDDCKKAAKTCKKTANQCKQENQLCQKRAQANDLASFEATLSPAAKSQFAQLPRLRQIKAMNYADHSNMPPDAAVAKALKGCNCTRK
jgi:hypothetical protein